MADNGLQEFLGVFERGERVLRQLRLLLEDVRVGGRGEERLTELVVGSGDGGVSHVVGKLAASLVKLLAVREERLLVASASAV